MFVSASRIVMRKVSADFCAATGAAQSSVAARVVASFKCTRILPSFIQTFSRQVTLYHLFARADHGDRRLATATLHRNAAARVEPASGRDIGRIGQRVAEPDIRDAPARLRR